MERDYEEIFQKVLDYEQTLHEKNRKRIKIGLKCIWIVPLFFLALLFLTGSNKVIFLILWIVSLFALSIYLIVVEYMDHNLQEKIMELKGEEGTIEAVTPADFDRAAQIIRKTREMIGEGLNSPAETQAEVTEKKDEAEEIKETEDGEEGESKLLKNGEASVCMRITVNGARVENNIRMSIEPALWNQAKECAKGKSRKACELNLYIEQAKIKLRKLFDELEERNHSITARILQEKFFGANEEVKEVRTLIQTIQEHNDQCRELVGKDYALITVRRYESCKRYLAELIKLKYDKEDLPLSEINGELVRAFEFYLKTEKECQQNTVIRYMKCLKKITNLALANEWITKDPFIGIKFHEKEVIREFLTMDELLTIYNKEFSQAEVTEKKDEAEEIKETEDGEEGE